MTAIVQADHGWDIDPRDDRKIYILWLGLLWVGIASGFAADLPHFLAQTPPASLVIHLHALVFVAWLVILTAQIALVNRDRVDLHMKLGRLAVVWVGLMLVLGAAASLTARAQYDATSRHPGALIAVNIADLGGFGVLTLVALAFRGQSAIHKRLMLLASVSLADPGFYRLLLAVQGVTGSLIPQASDATTRFVEIFYGNILIIGGMTIWDLVRRGRLHPAFVAGAVGLLSAEYAAAYVYGLPAFGQAAMRVVALWPIRN